MASSAHLQAAWQRAPEFMRLLADPPKPDEYFDSVRTLLVRGDWAGLASLMRLSCDACVALAVAGHRTDYTAFCVAVAALRYPWNTIFKHRLRAQEHLHAGRVREALEQHRCLVSLFLSAVFADGSADHLPVLYAILEDLADLAMAADENGRSTGKPAQALQESMQLFQGALAACLGDRTPDTRASRRRGALKIVNVQMKIFFRADQTTLVSKLIGTLAQRVQDEESLESMFDASDVARYRYYYARDCILNDRHADADAWLQRVLRCLPRSAVRSRRLTLCLLAPLRMAHGVLPKTAAGGAGGGAATMSPQNKVWKVAFEPYAPFAQAIRSANLGLFNRHLKTPAVSTLLYHYGLGDVADALRWLVLRRVVKKAYLASGESTRLSLEICGLAFKLSAGLGALDLSVQKIEYIMSVLIEMDMVRGYISHERQTVVLSGKLPFPPIKDQLYNTFALWDCWRRPLAGL